MNAKQTYLYTRQTEFSGLNTDLVKESAYLMLGVLEKIEKTLTEKHLGTENHTYELMLISDAIAKAKGV